MTTNQNQKIMEKERKITAPEGCEIEQVKIVDGVAVVTFKEKERKLPKSWEEFCEMCPVKHGECYVDGTCNVILREIVGITRSVKKDRNVLPDHATAEAVLALCQLIQLRDCYNGDWVPDWNDVMVTKYCIFFERSNIRSSAMLGCPELLYFTTEELRDEFLENFRDLVEKLKPLYGIKEGGEE